MRNRLTYFISIILVILLGLASRHFSEFLPGWINLYLGDILWAVMVFLMTGFLFRRKSTLWVAAAAIIFSYFIETSQIYHSPWLDNLRRTSIGGLILGFGFLWSDLVSYSVGVVLAVSLEKKLLMSRKL